MANRTGLTRASAELLTRAIALIREVAKLNCAKPPFGKIFYDYQECGECTSCKAREFLKFKETR